MTTDTLTNPHDQAAEARQARKLLDAGPLRPGMRRYRIPTELLWDNQGYRVLQATSATNAMEVYREFYPLSATGVSLANLQVNLADDLWLFASVVSEAVGGYSRQ